MGGHNKHKNLIHNEQGGFFNQFLGGRTGNTGQQGQGDGGTTTKAIPGECGLFGEDSREYNFAKDGNEVPQGGYAQRTNNNNSNNIINEE